MSFMTNSPISTAKLESSPPLPIEGARGLFSMSDGWYDIDDNGNVKKIVDTDISSTALGEGATALGLQNIAGCLGYYFTDIDFEHNRIVLSKDQGASPTESFEIDYEVGDIISIKNDREYVDCSIITEIKDNLIVVDALPFTSMYVKEKPAINDNAIYVAMKPDKGGVLITESSLVGGKECKALGALSIAIGNKNIATGYNAIALGSNTKALNWLAYTEGNKTEASGDYAHAEGGETKATAQGAHSEGRGSQALGNSCHAEGKDTVASNVASHAEGHRCKATAEGAHAQGIDTEASGRGAHAQGNGTNANGEASHASGLNTTAEGIGSFSAGNYSTANADYSFAMGEFIETEGRAQFAVGRYNELSEYPIFVVGIGVSDSHRKNGFEVDRQGNGHFAGDVTVGKDNNKLVTTKELNEKQTEIENKIAVKKGSADNSIQGAGGTASGFYSAAFGYGNTASGRHAFVAGGQANQAIGNFSHVEGYMNEAHQNAAHAEGEHTKALGYFSHSEGRGTIANATAQHTQGRYNIKDTENKYAHIVGNGKSDTERSNAHTVDWNGNAWFAGDVFAGSAYDKLATENWCNATLQQKISELVNSAPETLDTLNELAKALGDDPNFATTITNQIAKKTDKQDVENIIEAFVFPSILLQSPNGNKFKLTVSDNGTLSTELVEEVSK